MALTLSDRLNDDAGEYLDNLIGIVTHHLAAAGVCEIEVNACACDIRRAYTDALATLDEWEFETSTIQQEEHYLNAELEANLL